MSDVYLKAWHGGLGDALQFSTLPEEFYKQNSFLRSIKINYLKYGELSEKQIKSCYDRYQNTYGQDSINR